MRELTLFKCEGIRIIGDRPMPWVQHIAAEDFVECLQKAQSMIDNSDSKILMRIIEKVGGVAE